MRNICFFFLGIRLQLGAIINKTGPLQTPKNITWKDLLCFKAPTLFWVKYFIKTWLQVGMQIKYEWELLNANLTSLIWILY